MTDQAPPLPEPIQEESFPEFVTIVGVKIRDQGEVKQARTENLSLRVGDTVLLELDNDVTYGKVYGSPHVLPFTPPMRVMKSVLRKAGEEDEITIAYQQKVAVSGMEFCRERAEALGLCLKLVEVYGSFQRRALTFCYTAETRVDFRQLVKDLARHFSCRIEMRQISSREEARQLSGVDTCGLVLCCATFLSDFKPVNLKLSRKESVWGNDSHRIGVCGRLKCCLMFEGDDWPNPRPTRQPLIQLSRASH
jgi:cell fate regulator YaaT (PSP1 superfamily)